MSTCCRQEMLQLLAEACMASMEKKVAESSIQSTFDHLLVRCIILICCCLGPKSSMHKYTPLGVLLKSRF